MTEELPEIDLQTRSFGIASLEASGGGSSKLDANIRVNRERKTFWLYHDISVEDVDEWWKSSLDDRIALALKR